LKRSLPFIESYNNTPVGVKKYLCLKTAVFSKKTAGHLHARPFSWLAFSDPTLSRGQPERQAPPVSPQAPEQAQRQGPEL
jgi:hypothetical protein